LRRWCSRAGDHHSELQHAVIEHHDSANAVNDLALAILGGKDVFAAMSAALTAALTDDRTGHISTTSFAITLNAIISAVL
jgi:hypothetical protein